MFIMDEIRENTAGAIMTPEFVRLREGTRVGEAIRAVRASGLDSDALYTLSCTYEGKPLTLTFDKKSWGTWNIGTWRYNGEALAGGGTDWEYVNMVGDVGGSLDWSGARRTCL